MRAGKVQERDLATGLCNMAGNQIRLITCNIICAIAPPKLQWARKDERILEDSNAKNKQSIITKHRKQQLHQNCVIVIIPIIAITHRLDFESHGIKNVHRIEHLYFSGKDAALSTSML